MIKQKLRLKDLKERLDINNGLSNWENILCTYCWYCKNCVRGECFCGKDNISDLIDGFICFDCGNRFCEDCDEYYKIDIYQNKIDKIVCKSCWKIDVLNEKVKKLKQRKEN